MNLGLKTKYEDFLSWYVQNGFFFLRPNATGRENNSEKTSSLKGKIKLFRKELEAPSQSSFDSKVNEDSLAKLAFSDMWSDLELAWGKASSHPFFTDPESYLDIKYDLEANLQCYLQAQNERITITEKEAMRFGEGLTSFWKGCNNVEIGTIFDILSTSGTLVYNIVSYNYTNVLQELFKKLTKLHDFTANHSNVRPVKGTFYYVHGNIGQGVKLGVDRTEQITNEEFRKNEEVASACVKTVMHEIEGSNRQERIQSLINDSSILCVFGMSLGLTDQTWWKLIAKQLQNNQKAILMLFEREDLYGTETPYVMLPYIKRSTERFFKASGIEDKEIKERIKKQILVVYNSNIFDQEDIQIKEESRVTVLENLLKRLFPRNNNFFPF